MTVKAKLVCYCVKDYGTFQEVELRAQYSNNKEDNSFSVATPNATMTLTVSNPAIFGFYKPGNSYSLDTSARLVEQE